MSDPVAKEPSRGARRRNREGWFPADHGCSPCSSSCWTWSSRFRRKGLERTRSILVTEGFSAFQTALEVGEWETGVNRQERSLGILGDEGCGGLAAVGTSSISENPQQGLGIVAIGNFDDHSMIRCERGEFACLHDISPQQDEEFGGAITSFVALHEDVAAEQRQDFFGPNLLADSCHARKDRCGPGMTNSETAVEGIVSEGRAPERAKEKELTRVHARRVETKRGVFTTGSPGVRDLNSPGDDLKPVVVPAVIERTRDPTR